MQRVVLKEVRQLVQELLEDHGDDDDEEDRVRQLREVDWLLEDVAPPTPEPPREVALRRDARPSAASETPVDEGHHIRHRDVQRLHTGCGRRRKLTKQAKGSRVVKRKNNLNTRTLEKDHYKINSEYYKK